MTVGKWVCHWWQLTSNNLSFLSNSHICFEKFVSVLILTIFLLFHVCAGISQTWSAELKNAPSNKSTNQVANSDGNSASSGCWQAELMWNCLRNLAPSYLTCADQSPYFLHLAIHNNLIGLVYQDNLLLSSKFCHCRNRSIELFAGTTSWWLLSLSFCRYYVSFALCIAGCIKTCFF